VGVGPASVSAIAACGGLRAATAAAAARHVAAPNSVVEETNVTTATAAAAASAPKSATKSARHSGGESHQEAVTPTVADHPLGTRAMSASDAAPAARRCTTAGGFGDGTDAGGGRGGGLATMASKGRSTRLSAGGPGGGA